MRSHTVILGFWTQTCVACLARNPPRADGYEVEVIVVDNSPWSPAIYGITRTELCTAVPNLRTWNNNKSNKFHASALDCVVNDFNFDYLMALETDVMVLRPGWLQWFIDQMQGDDYAVGAWHHEQFINPSCTLYRGDVLRDMYNWCKDRGADAELLRWGPRFENSQLISLRQPERDYQSWYGEQIDWIAGPFAEKRGFSEGLVLKEKPSGQDKGPGWYEPGQQLHHWAVQTGYTYTVCPTLTTNRADSLPLQTLYGAWGHNLEASYPPTARLGCARRGHDPQRQLEAVELFGNAYTAHLWGGTRALDILKHAVTCQFVKSNTPMWLAREARFWKAVVPPEVQAQTLNLIRKYGWHITGQGNNVPRGDSRDRAAADFVRECYSEGGVTW